MTRRLSSTEPTTARYVWYGSRPTAIVCYRTDNGVPGRNTVEKHAVRSRILVHNAAPEMEQLMPIRNDAGLTSTQPVASVQQHIRALCAQYLGLPAARDADHFRRCPQRRKWTGEQVTQSDLLAAYVTLAFVAPDEAAGALVEHGAPADGAAAVVAALSAGSDEGLPAAVAALHCLIVPRRWRSLSPVAGVPAARTAATPLIIPRERATVRARVRAARRCGR